MPRGTIRPEGPDEWVRARIRQMRIALGWSQNDLARRVTNAGCKLAQSSLWSIEEGKPPRRVSIGEAVAFSKVFDIPLAELVTAPSSVHRWEDQAGIPWLQRMRWA
jgi:transcriptional regulator with XRE-family HTH domain